jgi:hypothetical protein
MEVVSVKPLQQKLLEAEERGTETSEICYRLGWTNTEGYGDTSKLKRVLGIMPQKKGMPLTKEIKYDIAVEICRALRVDPHEVNV